MNTIHDAKTFMDIIRQKASLVRSEAKFKRDLKKDIYDDFARKLIEQNLQSLNTEHERLNTELDMFVKTLDDKRAFAQEIEDETAQEKTIKPFVMYDLIRPHLPELKQLHDEARILSEVPKGLKDYTERGIAWFKKCYPEEDVSPSNEILIDRLTPSYRGTPEYYGAMTRLSSQQQMVFFHATELVLKKEEVTTSAVAKEARLEASQTASVLKMLEEKKFILSDKKNGRKTHTIDDPYFLAYANMAWFRNKYAM